MLHFRLCVDARLNRFALHCEQLTFLPEPAFTWIELVGMPSGCLGLLQSQYGRLLIAATSTQVRHCTYSRLLIVIDDPIILLSLHEPSVITALT
jgi:hypothetical protein